MDGVEVIGHTAIKMIHHLIFDTKKASERKIFDKNNKALYINTMVSKC